MLWEYVLGVGGVGALIWGIAAAWATFNTPIGDMVFDTVVDAGENVLVSITGYTKNNLPETLYLPAYTISPEEIFKGDILLFNVDFFSDPIEIKEEWGPALDKDGNTQIGSDGNAVQEIKSYYYEDEDGNKITTSPQNIAQDLRGTISSWYVGMRNIALVMMMIVLLYIGIRMLLSTLASDKAKYRQMLYDWLIGIVILFLMHYIMAFSVTLVSKLTKVVSSSVDKNGFSVLIADNDNGDLVEYIKNTGNEELISTIVNEKMESDENGKFVLYPTNLLGKMRLELQLANWGTEYIGYAICFVILVLFTLFFAFTYIRRVLYMAFLTLMAPLVAVTYPIDKISDGSAQGFDKWFKEYIFNLLIQPMHLLLYYILVTSAFNLASENLIYSIVAIGFMMPAEKLLRSFFGFDKASTPGVFAGAAGGALAMQAINKLGALGKGGKSSSGSSASAANGGTSSDDNATPKMRNDIDSTALMSGEEPNNDAGGSSAADATKYNPSEDPMRRAQREALEEKLADGQLDEGDLTDEQKSLLNMNNAGDESSENGAGESNGVGRALGRKIKAAGGIAGQRLKRKIHGAAKGMAASAKYKLKKTPGYLAKGTIKGIGAGAFATMGIAAGAATGDPSKAFSYGAAAGAVGYGLTNRSLIPKGNEEYRAARDSIRNTEKYNEVNRRDYIKKFKKDNKEILGKNVDKAQLKEMMQDGGSVERCLDNGITDIEDILAVQSMIDSGDAKSIDKAIAVAKYSNRVGSDYNTDKRGKWEEAFAKEFNEKAGMNKTNAKKTASQTMKQIDKFNKIKKDVFK